MNSKHIGADMILLGQPEIAVMGAKGASEIIFKKEINEAKIMKQSWRKKEYAELFAIRILLRNGFVDEVIAGQDTRRKLIKAFSMLENKASNPDRKHGKYSL
jgi:propionyl-CoA carboxylase beta chain